MWMGLFVSCGASGDPTNNTRYLGVRLSTTTADRYWVDTPYDLYICSP